ncbi:MAG: hypothetical protein QNJ87_01265 [Gammaproteobacteria bacterium]|nr:hypothetical protein [Gammaproteobacteria bacterium]
MRVVGIMAGVLLAALGGALFLRAAMPDLWLQLTEELPQRLAGVTRSDSVAEKPRTEPSVTSAQAAPPRIASRPPPALATREPGAAGETDGLAQGPDTGARSQESTAPAEEPPVAASEAEAEARSDATPRFLELQTSTGPAPGRAPGEALSGAAAAGAGTGTLPSSRPVAQARGNNEPPSASTAPIAWHAFWKPFRTESSAAGFASHIGAATGLPIEIRRNRHGRYLVGFAYAGPRELERNIALIEARTGLRVLAQAYR